jgi:hypothetical protein
MAYPPTLFVFAPALFPNTPLINRPVFVHGILTDVKIKPSEVILKGKDEKGEWSAYVEQYAERFEIGQWVRAYGLIVPQPDGNVSLAAKWAKRIEKEEYDYCTTQTMQGWEALRKEYRSMDTLQPFIPAPTKTLTPQTIPAPKTQNRSSDDPDFVSAAQFKVEREYL